MIRNSACRHDGKPNFFVSFHHNYHDDHHRYNSEHQHYNHEHPGITQQLVGGEDAVQAFMR